MNNSLPANESNHRLAEPIDENRPILGIRPAAEGKDLEAVIEDCYENGRPEFAKSLLDIRTFNINYLKIATDIAILLEGRLGTKDSGYLGDLIQSSRTIAPLKQLMNNRVRVLTSHKSILNAECHPIDLIDVSQIKPNGFHVSPKSFHNNVGYWSRLKTFVSQDTLVSPCLARFPSPLCTGLRLPATIPIGDKSVPIHREIADVGEADPLDHVVIEKSFWSSQQLHITEAICIWLELFGITPSSVPEPCLVTGAVSSMPCEVYTSSSGKPQMLSSELLSAVGERIPVFIFPATAGKSCKSWPAGRWSQFFHHLAKSDTAERIQLVFSRVGNGDVEYRRIRKKAIACGLSVTEFSVLLPELVQWLRTLSSAYPKLIVVGLDSMPAAHLGPSLGAHSVVIGHRHVDYGGAPIFSAPISRYGKTSLLVLPADGETDASAVRPEDVLYALKHLVSNSCSATSMV